MRRATICCLLSILLLSCGDEESALDTARARSAEEEAVAFMKACINGDTEAALARCMPPFRMLTRDWESADELRRNLPGHLSEMARAGKLADRAEVFGGRQLQAGHWPRGEELDTDSATRRLAQLGIDPGGFLVRLVAGSGVSVSLRVNPDQDGQLRVSGWLGAP